jgi:hypothetical protein
MDMLIKISRGPPNIKFNENSFSSFGDERCGQTDTTPSLRIYNFSVQMDACRLYRPSDFIDDLTCKRLLYLLKNQIKHLFKYVFAC